MAMNATLPTFERPPLIETVLSAQFNAIAGITNAHLGSFWAELGDDWPFTEDDQPLEDVYERFGREQAWVEPGIRFRITSKPVARLKIRNRDRNRMIQVQNGRFLYNWLRDPNSPYPRYSQVRSEFDDYFDRFRRYLAKCDLSEPNLNQWEVTYVNHLYQDKEWHSPVDWPKLFNRTAGGQLAPIGSLEPEEVNGNWTYVIPQQRGRLHVTLQSGRLNGPDTRRVLILRLTARGAPPTANREGLNAGLNLGREVIVREFEEMTSDQVHKLWGKVSQ